MQFKTCTACLKYLPLTEFNKSPKGRNGRQSNCRGCCKIKAAAYRARNRAAILIKARAYKMRNKEKRRAYYSRPDVVRRAVARRIEKKLKDPSFRLACNMRSKVSKMLKKMRPLSALQSLGCTFPELVTHLEKKFRDGMSWSNYGAVWHIDHVRPLSSFNLTDPVQFSEAWNFKNLQPLFAEENLRKWAHT